MPESRTRCSAGLFNICGIALIWPLPAIRRIPLRIAGGFAAVAENHRWIVIAYILICFYAVPFAAILLLR